MEIWTQEQEAENLAKLFAGRNRAAFARDFKVRGGQAMIYQHLKGMRPINLDQAICYAAGFGCGLEEISPRLAREVARAARITSGEASPPLSREWPFSIDIDRYESMPLNKKKQLDMLVQAFILGAAPVGLDIKK